MSCRLSEPSVFSVRASLRALLSVWLCGGCGLAGAQTAEVVVTAARQPMRVSQVLAEVTVLTRADIDNAAGRSLSELLSRVAGVGFSSTGGLGANSSVFLRGLEARHTLLLIDGVRFGSATVGTPSWDNLPLESIERIEIVRGPLSGLYGSDAVAGVVQIFTRQGREGVRSHGSLALGSHRYGQASAGVSVGRGDFDGAVQLQHTQTRGFSATNPSVPFGSFNGDDDGFRQHGGSAQAGWRFAPGWRAGVRMLYADGVSQYDDGPGTDSRARLRSEVMSVEVAGPVQTGWRSLLRWSRSRDAFDTLSSASMFSSLGVIATVQQQIAWENTVTTPLGTALLLAEHTRQTVRRPDTPFTVSERSMNAVAAGLQGEQGIYNWQANLRHDRNSQFGSQTTGSLALGADVAPSWRIGASIGTSFVAPSFNQLYFPGFGNPSLLPEEARQGELSLRWLGDGQQWRAAWFDNRIRGYIASGPAPTNVPRTRIDGLSLSYDAKLANWTLGASAEHIDPRNDTADSPNHGRQLRRRPRQTVRLAADVDVGAWRFGGSWMALGERYEDAANSQRLAGFATLDLRADVKLAPGWTLGLRLNNVVDKARETALGYNQPGREALVTLRYAAP
jgi:vitamin B12 transporter